VSVESRGGGQHLLDSFYQHTNLYEMKS